MGAGVASRRSGPSTFAAFAHRDFRLLWIGLVVANVGSWMQQFGLGWLLVQLAVRDGAPHLASFYIGLVGISRAIPGLSFGLFTGAFVDRMDRRLLLGLSQGMTTLLVAILAALTILDRIHVVSVLVIWMLLSIANTVEIPTRHAMLPGLVPPAALLSGVGLNSAAIQGSTFAGPLIGGLLIGTIGIGGLFAVNAVAHLAIVGVLFLMAPQPMPQSEEEVGMVRRIREGFTFVRGDSIVLSLLLTNLLAALLGRDSISQLVPAFAYERLGVGAVELSWLLGAAGVGSLVGAVAAASLGEIRRRGVGYCVSIIAAGALVVVFSLQRSLPLSLVLLFLNACAIQIMFGFYMGTLQTRAPNELRGRVMSIHLASYQFSGIGVLAFGSLGAVLGVDVGLGVAGAFVVLVAAGALVRSASLRDYGTAAEAAPARDRTVAEAVSVRDRTDAAASGARRD